MKYYLAGGFRRGPELHGYAGQLRALGHEVTARWLARSLDPALYLPDAGAAKEDMEDIARAYCLVFFAETPDAGYMSGGRMVEFGYALQAGKRLVLIGAPENVFHHLPGIERFPDFAAFLAAREIARNVGVMGDAGAGKDTLAALLVERAGYVRRALADEMKERLGFAIDPGLDISIPRQARRARDLVDGLKHQPAMRTILQLFGTEVMRANHGEDYWIDQLDGWAAEYAVGRPLVVPDVRFPNEVAALKALGFRIVNIARPGADGVLTPAQRAHASEGLDPALADLTIVNDGTIEDLWARWEAVR